jgi:hypothetical protein
MKDNIDNNVSNKTPESNSGSSLSTFSQAASAVHSTLSVIKMGWDFWNGRPPSAPTPPASNQ